MLFYLRNNSCRSEPYVCNVHRSEFGYEESPNWALCLTLVDLLLSRGMAAACLLDRCQSVSLQLVSDSRDNINREVDQYFVIG